MTRRWSPLLLIIVLVACSANDTPSPRQSVEDFATFTLEEASFRYPADWDRFDDGLVEEGGTVYFYGPDQTWVSAQTYYESDFASTDAFADHYVENQLSFLREPDDLTETSATEVAGAEDALVLTAEATWPAPPEGGHPLETEAKDFVKRRYVMRDVLAIGDEVSIRLEAAAPKENFQKYEPLFEEVLASLTFQP